MKDKVEIIFEEVTEGRVRIVSSVNTLFFFKRLPDNGELYLYSTVELTTRHTLMLEKSANVLLLKCDISSDFESFRKYTFRRHDNFTSIHDFADEVAVMIYEYDL